ncbi:MAG: 1-acylglycerol-3-phosphate O-acyltransferase [Planctomycetia bacterium]|nr:1-acylglycerol-3-phosphate O-acyltransferase [Planctomycetia bacterium]
MRTMWVVFNLILWTIILGIIGLLLSIIEWKGKIFGKIARIWSKIILASAGVKYSVYGLNYLDSKQNYIFAGNHESPFDIPLAFAGIKHHLISISKIEYKWIPIFGWAMQAAKHIFIDRHNHAKALESLKKAALSLKKNPRSILLFPEGTRSIDGKIHRFKKGGLLLAIETQFPVVPMALCGTGTVAIKGAKKLNSTPIELHIGQPIDTKGLTYDDRNILTDKVYKAVVQLKSEWEKNK